MLLTGDARGDHIINGLENANLMSGGRIHVDVFKIPHHGSSRNADLALYEKITADHYVISANGEHENPDPETFEWIAKARGDDPYTIPPDNPWPDGAQRVLFILDTRNSLEQQLLDEWIRHRLRAIQLKQWRRGVTIFRELTALGAKPNVAAQVAGNARRWWRNSGMLINSVLTIRWADQLGLPRLA